MLNEFLKPGRKFAWRGSLAVLAFISIASVGSADSPDSTKAMTATANGFYKAYESVQPDGLPDATDFAKLEPFLSPALDALIRNANTAEDRFAADNKDSPPLVEGDIFTSLFEGAKSFQIGVCAGDPRGGHCTVALNYSDPSNKPVHWTDTVYLVSTPAGWRVDDIAYGGNWDFGNKGRLSETLKYIIANASQ